MWKALIKWIESWSYRCEHDFEKIKETNVYDTPDSKLPYKTLFLYRCKKCCEFKQTTLK